MGLFGSEKEKIEKVECDGCNKLVYEDQLDENSLCEDCKDKVQCDDCENWFEEINDDSRCETCAKKAKEEEENEEADCVDCEKTFIVKDMEEDGDANYYCKECWDKRENNKLTKVNVYGPADKVLRLRATKNIAEVLYVDIITGLKTESDFIELKYNINDKITLRLSDIFRVEIKYTDEEFEQQEDEEE